MGRYDGGYYGFRPYVPVAKRRAQAAREVAKRMKKGEVVTPVRIEGRAIVSTFWGQAWCANLESYSDFENRLPRGRTYVRNGSVVHLSINKGRITALVSGSELYKIQIDIAAYSTQNWQALKKQCVGKVGTLVELLQGKLSKAVMELVTDRDRGLFPKPKEIRMDCSCPDSAGMCKHLAAVMYGVGNRLDSSPELLFALRAVDHGELIDQAIPTAPIGARGTAPTLDSDDLGAIFDIEIGDAPAAKPARKIRVEPAAKNVAKSKAAKPRVAKSKVATPKVATPKVATPKVAKAKVAKPAGKAKPAAARTKKKATRPKAK